MSKKIFSGDGSRAFWKTIGKVSHFQGHAILYDYGCKAQELETSHAALLAACERGHQRLLEMGQSESYRTVRILQQAITEAKEKNEGRKE